MSIKVKMRKLLRTLLRVTDNGIHDNDLEYLLWISSLYSEIYNVPGHIAEIGVANGRNTVLFGKLIRLFNDSHVRQYIGFDTFDGYTERDLERDTHLSGKAWKGNAFSKAAVEERCGSADVLEVVELIEGDAMKTVPEILSNHQGKLFQKGKAKFSLLYIDCNAYEPAIASMRHFYDYLMDNAIIAIDEKLQGGETEALSEFAAEKNLTVERSGTNTVPMMLRVRKSS